MRRDVGLVVFGLVVAAASLSTLAQPAPAAAALPGYKGNGVTLLPNGWSIAPEGRYVTVGDLPMNLVPSPDGRTIAISTSGYAKPAISLFDTKTLQIVGRIDVEHTWLGLVWQPDGKKIFASGASENVIYQFTLQNGRLAAAGSISLGAAERHPGRDVILNAGYVAGMALSPDGKRLYATQMYGERVRDLDVDQGKIVATADWPPSLSVLSLTADAGVSVWAARRCRADAAMPRRKRDRRRRASQRDRANARRRLPFTPARTPTPPAATRGEVATEDSVALRQARRRLIDAERPGATPDGAPPSRMHNIQMIADVSKPAPPRSRDSGRLVSDRRALRSRRQPPFVLDGKGLVGMVNPRGPQPGGARIESQYSGSMFQGGLSTIPMPNAAALARMTARVHELTPYSDARRLAPAGAPGASPIPRRVGETSPIKHVFYVIRENRTYDQILGDLPKANGDPSLALFGERVTPNAHALATTFTTFDNFYVDAEVSYDVASRRARMRPTSSKDVARQLRRAAKAT